MAVLALVFTVDGRLPLLAQNFAAAPGAELIQIRSADGIVLFADLYRSAAGTTGPIVILFHQAGSNARGEYQDIVPRLLANGFSALAVDLRIGGGLYGSENRTVVAGDLADSREYCSAYPDLVAAWEYVLEQRFSGPRFAWGSSFSAALVLHLAAERATEMSGALAFSPASGEPMEGCLPEQSLADLSIPALILRPAAEAAVERIAAQLDRFKAAGKETYVSNPGTHGSSMLSPSRVDGGTADTWRVVLAFLRSHSSTTQP
jgi:dienelactone hydrolase